jgi:acyl carrier protein
MQPNTQKPEDTFTRLQRVIAESTGHDIEEITLDTDFEDDLGLDADTDFPNLIPVIKMEFKEISLPNQDILSCATVAELVERIDDELF